MTVTPEAQLRAYFARFTPAHQKLVRAIRAALRKRLPTANELVYDYAASVVIAYAPGEHGIDGILALSARDDRVDLYFNQWRQVEDPKRLLQGTGKAVRFLTLESARRVSHPDVEALIASAVAGAKVPLARDGRGRLVFRTGAGSAKGKRTKKG